MRTHGIQNGEEDVNHKRISIPEATAFGQQLLTSFKHYESAWRTENTDLSPLALGPQAVTSSLNSSDLFADR
jgi:hypothetical protein